MRTSCAPAARLGPASGSVATARGAVPEWHVAQLSRVWHVAHEAFPRSASRPCVRMKSGREWLAGTGCVNANTGDLSSSFSALITGDSAALTWPEMHRMRA